MQHCLQGKHLVLLHMLQHSNVLQNAANNPLTPIQSACKHAAAKSA
jgi:hypothetical protein